MLRTLIHNPRRRGLVGALLVGSVPYVVAAWNNGILLGLDEDIWMAVVLLGAALGLIGYGICHGGFSVSQGFEDIEQMDWSDHDDHMRQFTSETGKFAWMYDDRIGRFDTDR